MCFRRFLFLVVFLVAGLMFIGCGDFGASTNDAGGPGGGGYYGGTPGGSQDFSYIRSLINEGYIPEPDLFLVEGLLSEYDLPIDGAPPEHLLNLRSACGYAGHPEIPDAGLYVQMGMISNLTEETFHRSPLNLSVVVDRSGSMGQSSASSGYSKMRLVRETLNFLVDQLNEGDILSVVLFNSEATVLFEPTPVDEPEALRAQISEIFESGTTNMDDGMTQGYNFVRENIELSNYAHRVMLFTDAMPNVGNTSPSNFQQIVEQGTEENIGLTSFGVGLDFDQELMDFFATQTGANYYYLDNIDSSEVMFTDGFEFMVSALAYNLRVEVTSNYGFSLADVYGFPGYDGTSAVMEVSTVFISRGRGAVLFRFEQDEGEEGNVATGTHVGNLALSYIMTDGELYSETVEVVYDGPAINDIDDQHFGQEGLHLAVVLARQVITMQEACELWGNEDTVQDGIDLLNDLEDFLYAEGEAFEADRLDEEIQMIEKLIDNMEKTDPE